MWLLIKSLPASAHRKQSGIPTSGCFPFREPVATYQISSCARARTQTAKSTRFHSISNFIYNMKRLIWVLFLLWKIAWAALVIFRAKRRAQRRFHAQRLGSLQKIAAEHMKIDEKNEAISDGNEKTKLSGANSVGTSHWNRRQYFFNIPDFYRVHQKT